LHQFIICCTGFQHAAFTLRSEAQLELSPYFKQHIPRGELVELLSKALLFTEAEKHWKGNFACKSGFSLLTPHVCNAELPKSITKRTDPPVAAQQRPEQPPPNGILDDAIAKRKATPPPSSETRAEKRARTEQNNTVSTVPECRILSSPMTRLSLISMS
jgi:transducin (beta)-like 1